MINPNKTRGGGKVWVIFLIGALITATITLFIIWIGHKMYLSMARREETFKIEKETYEKIKEKIREEEDL